ncbi:hypothetical protein AMS68_001712 [Peltaster fructicola]|uniref:YDG domain-containing protein n=1 Tax=Peltaster fructicola TaxID=286661 RepID=A0A6H0XNH9_9PEZI|nr:hypothetical protein AMS68_001712 [Peltaster fructicola]
MATVCVSTNGTISILDSNDLKSHSHWIRNTLDPLIARDGPEAISVEDALYLDQFFRKILLLTPSVKDIRLSRVHLALLEVAGRSTRWPHRLVERAEAVIRAWEARIGKLADIGIELLGPGGRLDGVASIASLACDNLLITWLKQGDKVLPVRARKRGNLGFTPGEYASSHGLRYATDFRSWWINPLFAFRDGIIDSGDNNGRIVADNNGAYAILLAGTDELASDSPEAFTYRSHARDRGRYRLTSATRDTRQPVRILRSHTLRSFWSPRAGIRYDGLYRVVGWSIHLDKYTKATVFDIQFLRLASEGPMDAVLCRPYTDEVEDYREFKRLRHHALMTQVKTSKLARMGIPPFVLTTDGVHEEVDEAVDEAVAMPGMCSLEDWWV